MSFMMMFALTVDPIDRNINDVAVPTIVRARDVQYDGEGERIGPRNQNRNIVWSKDAACYVRPEAQYYRHGSQKDKYRAEDDQV
jgi:hypothetical protein